MEKRVHILRHKRTGVFLVNPYGTFRGHGAYIGINPTREVVPNEPLELGNLVVELLENSKPTGFHIRDIEEYQIQTRGIVRSCVLE